MEKTSEAPPEPAKHKSYIFPVYVSLIVIIGVIVGWYLYHGQHTQVSSLSTKNSNLGTQLASINSQLKNAKAASNVTTAGWQTYCDPHGIFCFKYPQGWKVSSSYSADVRIGGATISNPAKTLSISYLDNYIKDGFAANYIFHSAHAINVGSNKLGVFGGYYVSSVDHVPFYAVLNAGDGTEFPSLSTKPGQNIYIGAPAGFLYSGGPYTSTIGQLIVRPTGKDFLTTQQADAWFNSIDGKTANLIASSLYEKQ